MRSCREISYREKVRRIRQLKRFRRLAQEYYRDDGEKGRSGTELQKLRAEVRLVVAASGISPVVYHLAPGSSWGPAGEIDVIENVLDVRGCGLKPCHLFEVLEKAIEVYSGERRRTIFQAVRFMRLLMQIFLSRGRKGGQGEAAEH